MNIISRIMGVDKTPEDKYKYIWFTMGTACFALATLVMTIVISRFLGEAKAGMFSIGLSIAQWLVTIAYFEIRTYQVTDVKNEYPFGYYFTLRLISGKHSIRCIKRLQSGESYCYIACMYL